VLIRLIIQIRQLEIRAHKRISGEITFCCPCQALERKSFYICLVFVNEPWQTFQKENGCMRAAYFVTRREAERAEGDVKLIGCVQAAEKWLARNHFGHDSTDSPNRRSLSLREQRNFTMTVSITV
jgi:hypothetical protein